MNDALNTLDATEAAARLAGGSVTSRDLVSSCLDRIALRDGEIGAWAHLEPAHALGQACMSDAAGRGPLRGIPVGIKDIFDTADLPTEYGSPIHEGHRPARDSACVAALRRAGAVILGKATTTEFASPVPVGVRNPRDFARSPGVSSSGSAAAVADFMVPVTLGSQTGGSMIMPAASCGVVGYKASLDGIDRGGLRHVRPGLDTIGIFARSVRDIALVRAAMADTPAVSWTRPRRPASASAAPPTGRTPCPRRWTPSTPPRRRWNGQERRWTMWTCRRSSTAPRPRSAS